MEKYSDKFLNQYNKLKNAKIGFEFEFYMRDISFYKTLELLNIELNPIKVWGFRQYHSGFTPDENNFKIEPDLSGGSNMCEMVTGPMPYYDAKHYFLKIVKFIQNYGYTNEKCSIHFNISFNNDKDLNDLNILKLILNMDENEVYEQFPTRKDNVYAKSVKNIIPYKDYDFFNIPISVIKNKIRLPNDKYYGINFLHVNNEKSTQRLEFRYIGGKDYEKKPGKLLYFLDKFIINSYDSIDVEFNENDKNILEDYLEDNISKFKNFSNYDNFLVEFPKVQLQVDQNSDYQVVSSYYVKIYDRLFNLIDSTNDLNDCIINYVSVTQKMEIVEGNIKCNSTLKNYDLISCSLDGVFENCTLISCDVKNSQISNSKIDNSDIIKSKVLNCKVESSNLKDCYFMQGYLNSEMYGGVFRSGELGPYAFMDSNVKVVNDHDNFFDKTYDEEEEKGDKKGNIDGFKK